MAAAVARFATIADPAKRPRLVLQLHDELVFEVPTPELAATARTVRDVLETEVTLADVRTEARLAAGANWAALAPL
jgi:DNA polymerase I-like protein with 3'-5' exonuclease and polymerase domains